MPCPASTACHATSPCPPRLQALVANCQEVDPTNASSCLRCMDGYNQVQQVDSTTGSATFSCMPVTAQARMALNATVAAGGGRMTADAFKLSAPQ